jgi:predicted chitinase
LLYKKSADNPNAPASYKTHKGFRLGSWQASLRGNYRKGKLSPDRIRRLEEISFTWDLLEEQFEKGFQETFLYKESTGNPNAPANYKTPEGYTLGTWQSTQRTRCKAGEISPERIKRLEEIGFTWERLEEQFEKGFQETLLHKEKTGNPNATQGYKTAEGFLLGNWQQSQTQIYKKGNLSSDRIKRLEEIGFKWVRLEEQFEKGFQQTLLYKERTGNPNAPQDYKTAEGFLLGNWQGHQKRNYKTGNLSPERIKRLDDISFKWEIRKEQFEEGFQETLLYKESTGNSNAPASYKTSEGYLLGSWQGNQKYNYRKGKLSPERIERLENIGFTWEIREEQYEKGFQETLLYKEKTGNPNAPASYKTHEGFRLGSWQASLRGNYRKGKLSPDRIRRLEEISFTWDLLEEQFEKGFQETFLYKERTGNPNAPQSYKTDEGFLLGTWQLSQRQIYKNGNLSPDRIKRLEDIGFTWDKLEEQFEKGFQETLLYKERTGNPNAPQDCKTAEGFLLGNWQGHQKRNYKTGNLSPERIKRLDDISFKWEIRKEQFEEGFQETLRYKERTGNPNAPQIYKTDEGYRLGTWQSNQRQNYRKGILSSDRIKRLENIGFTWDKFEEQFEKGFQQTLLYKERNGNPNATVTYKTAEGFQLGKWQGTQRSNYRTGKLSLERIKRLEEIGFKWGK